MNAAATGAGGTDEPVAGLIGRAMGEFLEMPGLRLVPAQAARLWAVDRGVSEQILDRLVEAGFLWKRRDGSYLRASRT
jgi:hypothetical protein